MVKRSLAILLLLGADALAEPAITPDEPFCGAGSRPTERFLAAQQRIDALSEADRKTYETATEAFEQGSVHFELHDWRSAERRFLETLQLTQDLDLPLEGSAANGLGAVYQNLANHRLAEDFHRRALAIALDYCEPSDDLVVALQANVASSLNRQERYPDAKAFLEAALGGFVSGANRVPEPLRWRREAQLVYQLGHALIYMGEFEAASKVLTPTLVSTARRGVLPPVFVADMLQLLGKAESGAGRTDAAAHYYDQAIQIYEQYFPHGTILQETIHLRERLP